MHWWPHMGTGGWFMVIFSIIVIVAIVWVIAYLLKEQGSREKGSATNEKEDPIEIARLRYARGEIKKEEMEEIIDNLKKQKRS